MIKSGTTVVSIVAVAALPGCGGSDSSGTSSTASGGGAQAPGPKAPAKPQGGTLAMQMGEMFFRPKRVTAPAGHLRITQRNVGQVNHEFILVRSRADPGSLPVSGGRVDEAKLNVVGEIADVASGQTKGKTFRLKPGKHLFICNVPGHYSAGMYGGLNVR